MLPQVQHAVRLIKAKLAGGANAQPLPGGLASSGDAVTEEMMVQRDAAGGLIGKASASCPPPRPASASHGLNCPHTPCMCICTTLTAPPPV